MIPDVFDEFVDLIGIADRETSAEDAGAEAL